MMLAWLSLALAACSALSGGASATPLPSLTPPPTLAPVIVAYTPAVRPARAGLAACAQALPHLAIFHQEISAAGLAEAGADLLIRLGQLPTEPASGTLSALAAAPLAWEQVRVITNADNPQTQLSNAELIELYAGRQTHWPEAGAAVEIWVYPPGDDAGTAFWTALSVGSAPSSLALLAPDPAAMLTGVQAQPGALGFIPQAWLEAGVQPVDIEPDLAEMLRVPILAYAIDPPSRPTTELLACLQSGPGQAALLELYDPYTEAQP